MERKDKEKCAMAGMSLARDFSAFISASPTIFQDNLKGLVETSDFKVPSSELALHQGAAGKEIIAFFLSPQLAFAVYAEPNGGCGYIHGLQSEILQRPLIEKATEIWGTGVRGSRA